MIGKATLARMVANAMGVSIKSTSGPALEKAGDLAGLLTNLEEGDVLFVDEIHLLPIEQGEYLRLAMEMFKLDLVIDTGLNARSVRLALPRFTLIGATTVPGQLSPDLLGRFRIREKLEYYHAEQLQKIVERSARLLNIEVTTAAAAEIADRSRGTPRVANYFLWHTRDCAQAWGENRITPDIANKALALLGIEDGGSGQGLTELLEDLNSMVGLGRVKEEVNGLVNLIKVRKLRHDRGIKSPPLSLHLVFRVIRAREKLQWLGFWEGFSRHWASFPKATWWRLIERAWSPATWVRPP